MIKPSDITTTPVTLTPAQARDRAAIESHIDAAIVAWTAARKPWPCVVKEGRSGLALSEIPVVLQAYRDAGWAVLAGDRKALCALEPAVPGAIANRVDEGLAAAIESSRVEVSSDALAGARAQAAASEADYSPDEIVVGPGGQTLAQAAALERLERAQAEHIAAMDAAVACGAVPETEPAPGAEQRMVDRALREGALTAR